MKHPFAVGLGVGVTGLVLWWKRHVIASWFMRMRHPLAGAEVNTSALIQALLVRHAPALLIVAPHTGDGRFARVMPVVQSEPSSRGPVIDVEAWPSSSTPKSAT